MKRKTIAIHGNQEEHHRFKQGLASPISPSTTFWFHSVAEAEGAFSGANNNYVYSRGRNPNLEELEEKMTLLEEGSFAVSFASGMGAISSLLLALLKPGDKVGAHQILYGSSHNLIKNILPTFGIQSLLGDLRIEENLLRMKKEGVKVVFFETPCNPTLEVLDISRIKKILGPEIMVIVDSTFASPALQRPLTLGADFVVHSASKYIGGHGDAIGGLVVGMDKALDSILRFDTMCEFGAVLSPFNAWLFLRGLKTLDYRMKGHCENALAVAKFLEGHPKVKKVYYPGLFSSPDYALASSQMENFGGMVSFELKAGEKESIAMAEGLHLFKLAVSLGDVESLVEHPMRMTHRSYTEEECEEFGVSKNLIRLSLGLEDKEDLIEDLAQALGQCK